jgi:hypothetical protein
VLAEWIKERGKHARGVRTDRAALNNTDIRCRWLGHSDARQVSDLPESAFIDLSVYDRRVRDPEKKWDRHRQVADMPRIGVAEPLQRRL